MCAAVRNMNRLCHMIFLKEDFFLFFSGEGSSTFLNFVKGDLILLDEDTSGEAVLTSGWCTGTCERNEERGDFPAEAVYVLPCLSRPPDDILVSFFDRDI